MDINKNYEGKIKKTSSQLDKQKEGAISLNDISSEISNDNTPELNRVAMINDNNEVLQADQRTKDEKEDVDNLPYYSLGDGGD